MYSDEIENTLCLLAATIFADRRVFSEEITAFVEGTARLKIIREAQPKLTQTDLLLWFEANSPDIKTKMTTPYFKDWFYELLDKLSGFKDKEALLSIMREISKADNHVHVKERALFSLAARHWGIALTF